jgi:tRNA-modifying protein YgfZ
MKTGVLREVHRTEAREISVYHDWEMPAVYSSVDQEFQAATTGTALVDHSFFGRLEVNGADGLDLLHRLSTNDLRSLRPGQVTLTAITTDKGRLVDYVKVARTSPAPHLFVSPNNEEALTHWIDRYCITEDVRLRCVTNDTSLFTFVGPRAQATATNILGVELPSGTAVEAKIGATSATVAYVETPRVEMVHFLVQNDVAEQFWRELVRGGEKLGVLRMGLAAYETFRIARGIPDFGREITGEFNPFEVGLRDSISLTKGCYLGQEVIARLDTYQKVKRKLVGILFKTSSPSAVMPVPLLAEGVEVGVMTSCSPHAVNGMYMGLAVVRSDRVHEGDALLPANSTENGIVITTPILL